MSEPTTTSPAIRVWDLPTRLFHWALVVLVIFSVATAKIGGNWTEWHMRSGYTILTLIVFRILWGLAGSRHAQFANFVRGPAVTLRYARQMLAGTAQRHAGHNPLGALSVLALLAALLAQASTGLFANDDIANEGPWAKFVSSAASSLLTTFHRYNEKVIYVLLALHLAAVAYYVFAKRDNIVLPMINGDKRGHDAAPIADDATLRVRALILLALAAGLVAYLVGL